MDFSLSHRHLEEVQVTPRKRVLSFSKGVSVLPLISLGVPSPAGSETCGAGAVLGVGGHLRTGHVINMRLFLSFRKLFSFTDLTSSPVLGSG